MGDGMERSGPLTPDELRDRVIDLQRLLSDTRAERERAQGDILGAEAENERLRTLLRRASDHIERPATALRLMLP